MAFDHVLLVSAAPPYHASGLARDKTGAPRRRFAAAIFRDPERPDIASTLWRTVSDTRAKRYVFESALSPSAFRVDLGKLDLSAPGRVLKPDLQSRPILSGEVSASFTPAEPLRFIAPPS